MHGKINLNNLTRSISSPSYTSSSTHGPNSTKTSFRSDYTGHSSITKPFDQCDAISDAFEDQTTVRANSVSSRVISQSYYTGNHGKNVINKDSNEVRSTSTHSNSFNQIQRPKSISVVSDHSSRYSQPRRSHKDRDLGYTQNDINMNRAPSLVDHHNNDANEFESYHGQENERNDQSIRNSSSDTSSLDLMELERQLRTFDIAEEQKEQIRNSIKKRKKSKDKGATSTGRSISKKDKKTNLGGTDLLRKSYQKRGGDNHQDDSDSQNDSAIDSYRSGTSGNSSRSQKSTVLKPKMNRVKDFRKLGSYSQDLPMDHNMNEEDNICRMGMPGNPLDFRPSGKRQGSLKNSKGSKKKLSNSKSSDLNKQSRSIKLTLTKEKDPIQRTRSSSKNKSTVGELFTLERTISKTGTALFHNLKGQGKTTDGNQSNDSDREESTHIPMKKTVSYDYKQIMSKKEQMQKSATFDRFFRKMSLKKKGSHTC